MADVAEPGVVKIPMVGGPRHGQTVDAVLGPDGRPPLTHSVVDNGKLGDAPTYEIESTQDADLPWRYVFRPPRDNDDVSGDVSGDPDFASDFATEHDSASFAEEAQGPEGPGGDGMPKGLAGAD